MPSLKASTYGAGEAQSAQVNVHAIQSAIDDAHATYMSAAFPRPQVVEVEGTLDVNTRLNADGTIPPVQYCGFYFGRPGINVRSGVHLIGKDGAKFRPSEPIKAPYTNLVWIAHLTPTAVLPGGTPRQRAEATVITRNTAVQNIEFDFSHFTYDEITAMMTGCMTVVAHRANNFSISYNLLRKLMAQITVGAISTAFLSENGDIDHNELLGTRKLFYRPPGWKTGDPLQWIETDAAPFEANLPAGSIENHWLAQTNGIWIDGARNIRVTNNHVRFAQNACGAYGNHDVDQPSTGNLFQKNLLEHWKGVGIPMHCQSTRVVENTFRASGNAVVLTASAAPGFETYAITVEDNLFVNTWQPNARPAAVLMQGSGHVTGNHIRRNELDGMGALLHVTNPLASGNAAYNNRTLSGGNPTVAEYTEAVGAEAATNDVYENAVLA